MNSNSYLTNWSNSNFNINSLNFNSLNLPFSISDPHGLPLPLHLSHTNADDMSDKNNVDDKYIKNNIDDKYVKNNIDVLYQNTRSIKNKMSDTFVNSLSHHYELIILTETWLEPSISSYHYFDKDLYFVYRSDRVSKTKCRGGGVLCAINIKSILKHHQIKLPDNIVNTNEIDTLGVFVEHHNYNYRIIVIYIPPDVTNNKITILCKYLSCLETFLATFNCKLLIMGDFNLPNFCNNNLYINNKLNLSISSFISTVNLQQINTIRNCNNNILDLIFVNYSNCFIITAEPLVPPDKFHPPLLLHSFNNSYSGNNLPIHNDNHTNKYFIQNLNVLQYKAQLRAVNWDQLFKQVNGLVNQQSVDHICDIFYDKIFEVLDSNIITNNTTKTNDSFPYWYSRELTSLFKIKGKFMSINKARPSGANSLRIKDISLKIKQLICRDLKIHNSNIENNAKYHPKQFWKSINSKRNNNSTVKCLLINDIITYDSIIIASSFAEYFADVFNTNDFSSACSPCDMLHNVYINNHLISINSTDISRELLSLNSSNTCGLDNLSNAIIKLCPDAIIYPLQFIFNLAIKDGTFPTRWKQSKVIPVPKKGNNLLVDSYRQVSLLPNFSKIFEKLIYDIILSYFSPYQSHSQHGFTKRRSTCSNLLTFTEYVMSKLNNNQQVDVIYTDLSKAFDKINWNTLIVKLYQINLPLCIIKLISSYLVNRSCSVFVNGETSMPYHPSSGVPQGSNLGPLLFNIYINELPEKLSCYSLLYADDTKLYLPISSLMDCHHLQYNLNKFANWCSTNSLSVNASKCYVMSYTRSKNPILFNYCINGCSLPRTDVFTDLGITFDNKLLFNSQVEKVAKAALSALGLVIRLSHAFTGRDSIISLYNSFVRSKYDYCIAVYPLRTVKQAKLLNKGHRRFVKYLVKKTQGKYMPRGCDDVSLVRDAGMVTLSLRRDSTIIMYFIKILYGLVDCPDLTDIIKVKPDTGRLRYTSPFSVPNTVKSSSLSPLQSMVELTNFACRKTCLFNRIINMDHISCDYLLYCLQKSQES
ncbi:uncharacterized protein LOC122859587 isoform X2 [Aphidius gifuensis]|nr:uncharacterized protein LOC122859587 isoform X2 [Aphidius gifuensis]